MHDSGCVISLYEKMNNIFSGKYIKCSVCALLIMSKYHIIVVPIYDVVMCFLVVAYQVLY